MSSFLDANASVAIVNEVGATGTIGLYVADDDLIVTSTNMKLGTYTVAAQPKTACRISVLATAVGATDTLGTISIVGTNEKGVTTTEVVTPIAGTTVFTVGHFSTITSVTGVAWVISEGNDTIKVGVDYSQPPVGYYIFAIQVMATTVVTSQVDISGSINAKLSTLTGVPVNAKVYGKWSKITLTSGEAIGYLARAV